MFFYRKLRKEFEAYGLEVNPYNPCIANMMTKLGKQPTIVWHVDNLMGFSKEDFKLTRFSCYPARIYGTKFSMHTGKRHNYHGMDMEFKGDRMLEVSLIAYFKGVIEQFPEEITGKVATPAAELMILA